MNQKTDILQQLIECKFLGTPDPEFQAFVDRMPDKHWARYDLSAVRLGWEARKTSFPFRPLLQENLSDREFIRMVEDWIPDSEEWVQQMFHRLIISVNEG